MCALFEIYKAEGAEAKTKLDFDGNLIPGQYRCYRNIQIVVESPQKRKLLDAFWQFRMQMVDGQLKADRYPSFNSRWQDQAGGGFKPSFRRAYKESRCIIPASAFVEGKTDPDEKSNGKVYHLLRNKSGRPIYFGGLYKEWEINGEIQYSASMITKAGHTKMKDIHPKAMPLILPDDSIDMWLDPEFKETAAFSDLMEPLIVEDMIAQQISGFTKTSSFSGVEFEIQAD